MLTVAQRKKLDISFDSPLKGPWQALLDSVRAYRPDVVILIARKTPRLAELLGLDFSFCDEALVLTDMAIPFAHSFIRGRRVAIVDDLVNVGSTLAQAKNAVEACGASGIGLFALGRRATAKSSEVVECVFKEPLRSEQYELLVKSVPDHLRRLNKPYDLEFPIVECAVRTPYRSPEVLLSRLRSLYSPAAVHDLTVQPTRDGLTRFTIDVGSTLHTNYKLRLYLDSTTGLCNVVPFAIPFHLDERPQLERPVAAAVLVALEQALQGSPRTSGIAEAEPLARAWLFVRSLDFGLAEIDRLSEVLRLPTRPFSTRDAGVLFGPSVRDETPLSSLVGANPITSSNPPEAQSRGSLTSLFWENVLASPSLGLIERVRGVLPGRPDAVRLFEATFQLLSELLGASSAADYSLTWPYSTEEVRINPYLRLRAGPTFFDLVSWYRLICPLDHPRHESTSRHIVSAVLDYLIDSGAVVPTLAWYDGHLHRVYRKGEPGARDAAMDRIIYAWEAFAKPLPRTRAAKINAVLAFSSRLAEVSLPQTIERGNVATLQQTLLDVDSEEIIKYARDIGRLERVSGGDSGESA